MKHFTVFIISPRAIRHIFRCEPGKFFFTIVTDVETLLDLQFAAAGEGRLTMAAPTVKNWIGGGMSFAGTREAAVPRAYNGQQVHTIEKKRMLHGV